MLNQKWYQASKPEMEFHMINIMYSAWPMRAQTEKTTFSWRLYIDEAHMALGIFRFAVFLKYNLKMLEHHREKYTSPSSQLVFLPVHYETACILWDLKWINFDAKSEIFLFTNVLQISFHSSYLKNTEFRMHWEILDKMLSKPKLNIGWKCSV